MSLDFPAFALSDEHRALRESVRALAEDKIAAEVDRTAEFPWDVHDAQGGPQAVGGTCLEAYGGAARCDRDRIVIDGGGSVRARRRR